MVIEERFQKKKKEEDEQGKEEKKENKKVIYSQSELETTGADVGMAGEGAIGRDEEGFIVGWVDDEETDVGEGQLKDGKNICALGTSETNKPNNNNKKKKKGKKGKGKGTK